MVSPQQSEKRGARVCVNFLPTFSNCCKVAANILSSCCSMALNSFPCRLGTCSYVCDESTNCHCHRVKTQLKLDRPSACRPIFRQGRSRRVGVPWGGTRPPPPSPRRRQTLALRPLGVTALSGGDKALDPGCRPCQPSSKSASVRPDCWWPFVHAFRRGCFCFYCPHTGFCEVYWLAL